jgi:TonB family protein
MSRAQTMGVTVGLAALVVIGGVIVILPRHNTRSVPAVERIPNPTVVDGDTLGTEYGLPAGSQRPFLVEVLDANNRQWLLWFEADSLKDAPTEAAYKSPLPASTTSSRGASRPKQPAPSPKPAAPNKFTLTAPKASQPETNSSAASLVAPVVRDELHPPLEAPIASILTSRATSKPVEESTPIGGRVQLARLLKSVPPVYPPFARTSHVAGDVKLDALIDVNGNVMELKVVSGPPILRQPAMDAVRQWKYEPARLNGQPVVLHLDVTVRFRVE